MCSVYMSSVFKFVENLCIIFSIKTEMVRCVCVVFVSPELQRFHFKTNETGGASVMSITVIIIIKDNKNVHRLIKCFWFFNVQHLLCKQTI